jgi:hypothetical protein
LLVTLFVSVCAPPLRAASDPPACEDASVKGQKLAKGKQLIEARAEFRKCAADTCKQSRRDDCNAAIAALEERIPTVVLEARRGTEQLREVRVTIDGAPAKEHLDGVAFELDPGEHEFVFTYAGETVRVRQAIAESKKGQNVTATFTPAAKPVEPDKAVTAPAPAPSPSPSVDTGTGSGQHTAGLVIAGVGVVGLGVGGLLGLSARSSANGVDCPNNHCSSQADADQRNAAVSRGNLASVFVGVGAALAVGGVVVWLVAPSDPKAAGVTTVGVSPTGLVLGGRF